MSSVYLGTTPVKISTEITFDPRYGYQTRETYAGPAASLSTLNAAFQLTGIRTTTNQTAGKTYLDVYYAVQNPGAGGVETPTDFYDLETDYYQESIWNSEAVFLMAKEALAEGLLANRFASLIALGFWTAAEVSTVTPADVLTFWRRECEAALKGRTLNVGGEDRSVDNPTSADTANGLVPRVTGPLDFNSSAVRQFDRLEKAIYRMLVRDEIAYESTRQVLTRQRTISINYSAKVVAEARPVIYLTSDLITVFGIPSAIALRLPADPTDLPQDHVWAWKQQRNTAKYEWNGRVTEVASWTFAAWSYVTHWLYPSNIKPL